MKHGKLLQNFFQRILNSAKKELQVLLEQIEINSILFSLFNTVNEWKETKEKSNGSIKRFFIIILGHAIFKKNSGNGLLNHYITVQHEQNRRIKMKAD